MNIPKIKYSDFLIDQTPPPMSKEKEYVSFYLKHIEYCKSGVSVGGIHISGWLYWHINFFKIPIDSLDQYGNSVSKISNLDFRDNEFYIDYSVEKAYKDPLKKPLMIFGTRRFAKSVFLASRVAYKSFIFQNSHSVIVGASSSDIGNITKYINDFMSAKPDCFSDLRKVGDWSKTSSDVEIAFSKLEASKAAKGENRVTNPLTKHLFTDVNMNENKIIFSRIATRNLEHGQSKSKEEILAGITPTEVIVDEALRGSTPIPTPNGWTTMEDIQVGDFVFGKNGTPVEVVNKVDVGVKPLYRVKLLDGRYLDACEDHNWEVYDTASHKYRKLKTKELIPIYLNQQIDKRYNKIVKKRRFAIDLPKPIEYTKKDLPLDPYYVGLYLGDGNTGTGGVVSQDDYIKDYLRTYFTSLGLGLNEYSHKNNVVTITPNSKETRLNPLREELKNLGIYDKKFIPNLYLQSSVEDRIELLRGLMDTDGTIGKLGVASFSTSNVDIKDTFLELCSSLGVRYYVQNKKPSYNSKGEKKRGKDSYSISIYTDFNPFRLERKKERVKDFGEHKKAIFYRNRVSIDDITLVDSDQSYCITVKADDSLFLAGNSMVTGNCGKFSFKNQWLALKPAIATNLGTPRTVVLFSGTGGDVDNSKDAEEYFLDADGSNFTRIDPTEYKKVVNDEYFKLDQKNTNTGLFVPKDMSLEGGAKIKIPLSDYVKREYSKQDLEDLEGFYISVTDWDKTKKHFEDSLGRLKDDLERIKQTMYYPSQPEDCFLVKGNNPFPAEQAKKTRMSLAEHGLLGEYVTLSQGLDGTIYYNPSNLTPIKDFPFKGGSYDAPVVILEKPIFSEPSSIKYGTYVAGFDGYKINSSDTTDSVGSFYIFKRSIGITGYRNQIVAHIATRPKDTNSFYKQCLLLLKAYNAELLPEYDTNLHNYLNANNALGYMANCQNVVEMIVPKSVANTACGLPSNARTKAHYLELVKSYCWEEVIMGYDENGVAITCLGVERIHDPMLLEELEGYRPNGNFDRIAAFGHALVWHDHLNIRGIQVDEEQRFIEDTTARDILRGAKNIRNMRSGKFKKRVRKR